jgi:hypothetical protein
MHGIRLGGLMPVVASTWNLDEDTNHCWQARTRRGQVLRCQCQRTNRLESTSQARHGWQLLWLGGRDPLALLAYRVPRAGWWLASLEGGKHLGKVWSASGARAGGAGSRDTSRKGRPVQHRQLKVRICVLRVRMRLCLRLRMRDVTSASTSFRGHGNGASA